MIDLKAEYGKEELLKIDIQFLGLEKGPWIESRGARIERHYTDSTGTTIIKDYYDYTWSVDKRCVESYTRVIEWLDSSGSLWFDHDVTPLQSVKRIKELNRAIRQGQIDYLELAAENLRFLALVAEEPVKTQYNSIADSIEGMFSHYLPEITNYVARGTQEFENAVNSETDPSILGVLDIPAKAPDSNFPNGLTVKQSIMFQLLGVVP